MLDRASLRSEGRPDVLGPAPPGLVGRPSDREPSDVDQLESALRHVADLIGGLEPLQDDVDVSHAYPSGRPMSLPRTAPLGRNTFSRRQYSPIPPRIFVVIARATHPGGRSSAAGGRSA